MQGSEAVWQLVLDVHLHCVYPGPNEIGYDMFGYNVPILPQLVKRRATLSPLWNPARTSPVPATIRPTVPGKKNPQPDSGFTPALLCTTIEYLLGDGTRTHCCRPCT